MKKLIISILCTFFFISAGAFSQPPNSISSWADMQQFVDAVNNGYSYLGDTVFLNTNIGHPDTP